MKPDYDSVIIGGGLGGLSTAALLSRQGKRVLVLERYKQVGGYASNFQRGGFTFDVSLHAMNGMTPGTPSYRCLQDCGIADKVTFLPQKTVYRLVTRQGDLIVRHEGIDAYQQFLCERYPQEAENIRQLFSAAGKMYQQLSGFVQSPDPFWWKVLSTPMRFPRLMRYDNDTVDQFFSRFTQHPELKEILAAQWPYYGLPPEQLAYSYFSYPFFDYLAHGGYSVKGGSQSLSDALAESVRAAGGSVETSRSVIQIHHQNGQVTGLTSKKIGDIRTQHVVSNISPQATVQLAGRDAFPASFLNKLDNMQPAMSAFQIYIGLDCPLSTFGIGPDEYSVFFCDGLSSSSQFQQMCSAPEQIDFRDTGWFLNLFTNVDPGLAPAGKSTIGIIALVSGKHWQQLQKNEYQARKTAMTEALLTQLEQRFPGIRSHIEVLEAGTPKTMTTYTGNYMGSINGFAQTTDQAGVWRRFPMRYPLKGLYQVGAWTFPGGGYVGAMLSARMLVDRYFRR